MEGTYLISDFKPSLKALSTSINLPEKQVIAFQSFEKEHGYHDWITAIFNENNIKKLIIPISIPTDAAINTAGIMIVLHLRLNYELKINQRLIPVVFLSDFTIDKLLISNNFDNDTNPLNLLFSKGVYLSSFDSDNVKSAISKAEPCAAKDYQKQVLSKLKILQKANSGKHSIANAWGCYKLSQVTGLYDTIIKHPGVSEQLKTLYAKYLICSNDTFTAERFIDLKPINCKGRKILFIDDQADEGWSVIMQNIFKSAGNKFVSVDSSKYKNKETNIFHNYDGFFTECKSHLGEDWDLIIIDLRLNPEKEDIDNEMITPTKFSGYELIDLFLNSNAGYQIIVSTASNKIWNINAALERGASSYYVKESPEFNYSVSETKKHYDNFKTDVQNCFDRDYLRTIWTETQNCNFHLDSLKRKNLLDKDYVGAIHTFLDLAFDAINNPSREYPFDSAFMYYFLVLEASANQIINTDSPSPVAITNIKGEKITGYKFAFRKSGQILKDFIGNSYVQTIIGDDLISATKRIPYDPKFHNLIDYAMVTGVNSIDLVKIRNDFNHPDLINNRRIAMINSNNLIDIFNVVKSLLCNLS